jgi:enterochelin esterase family protein
MKKINFILALFIINISAFAQQALWGQQNIVSPEIHENNTVTFRLKAPKAIIVEVTGDFLPAGKNGEAGKASLTENKDGIWEFTTNEPLVSEPYGELFYTELAERLLIQND